MTIVYNNVEMAKANDLNTYKYLTYSLTQRPTKNVQITVEQLGPRERDCENNELSKTK